MCIITREHNIAEDWTAYKKPQDVCPAAFVVESYGYIPLGNQRMAVDVHLAACGRAGVLADHVTAVPDVVADGESGGFRLTQSAGVVGVIWD